MTQIESLSNIPATDAWRFPPMKEQSSGRFVIPHWVQDLFPTEKDASNPAAFIEQHAGQRVDEPWNVFAITDAPIVCPARGEDAGVVKSINDTYTVSKLTDSIKNSRT